MTNGASNVVLSSLYYNSRLQPCRIAVNSSGMAPGSCTDSNTGNVMDLVYNFNAGSSDNGNVMGITSKTDNTRSQTFTYDSLNRLATAAASTYATSPSNCWGETFSIDRYGNLYNIGAISSAYTGCTQENLGITVSSSSNQISGSGYTYDSAGNMTAASSTSYSYNADNQMTSAAGVTYTYDGDGKRVKKSSGTLYWYGTSGDPLAETDTSGNTTNEYVFFQGRRIARRDSSANVFYYFADQLGTSRAIVQAGSTSSCYDADFYPYGGERTPHVNTCSQNYKFTGKERDSESGLDNSQARYMASQMGRFMSPDLMGGHFVNPQSLNRYAYVHNNPLNMTDPTGLDCVYENEDDPSSDTVVRGDCINDADNGVFVNGTVDTQAGALLGSDGTLSLSYFDDNGHEQGFIGEAGDPTSASYLGLDPNAGNYGFGSPQYATQLFSQVYNNPAVQGVNSGKGIAGFIGGSAIVGASGVATAAYGAEAVAAGGKALGAVESSAEAGYNILNYATGNLEYLQNAYDVAYSYLVNGDPAFPATWWQMAGTAAGAIADSWSEISRTIKAEIPH